MNFVPSEIFPTDFCLRIVRVIHDAKCNRGRSDESGRIVRSFIIATAYWSSFAAIAITALRFLFEEQSIDFLFKLFEFFIERFGVQWTFFVRLLLQWFAWIFWFIVFAVEFPKTFGRLRREQFQEFG